MARRTAARWRVHHLQAAICPEAAPRHGRVHQERAPQGLPPRLRVALRHHQEPGEPNPRGLAASWRGLRERASKRHHRGEEDRRFIVFFYSFGTFEASAFRRCILPAAAANIENSRDDKSPNKKV